MVDATLQHFMTEFEDSGHLNVRNFVQTMESKQTNDFSESKLFDLVTLLMKKWGSGSYKSTPDLMKACVEIACIMTRLTRNTIGSNGVSAPRPGDLKKKFGLELDHQLKIITFAVANCPKLACFDASVELITECSLLLNALRVDLSKKPDKSSDILKEILDDVMLSTSKLFVQFIQSTSILATRLNRTNIVGSLQLQQFSDCFECAICSDAVATVRETLPSSQVGNLFSFALDAFWNFSQRCVELKCVDRFLVILSDYVIPLLKEMRHIPLIRSMDVVSFTVYFIVC
jgi:hypothetical protein